MTTPGKAELLSHSWNAVITASHSLSLTSHHPSLLVVASGNFVCGVPEHHTVHKRCTDVILQLIRTSLCLFHFCLNLLFDNALPGPLQVSYMAAKTFRRC